MVPLSIDKRVLLLRGNHGLYNGEPWKKIFGPVLVYLNAAAIATTEILWNDAKDQMIYVGQSWPYNWPNSEDYLKPDERGEISGKLFGNDRFHCHQSDFMLQPFLGASVTCQFWTQADVDGYFTIPNVRELYGCVPAVFGDYKREGVITIQSGSSIDLDELLIFEAPRDGKTVWEIGIPNRSASEFFVPDPDPKYVNRLFLDHPER